MGSDVRIVNAPDSVFLCYGVDKEVGDVDHNECSEVAWSDERIFDTDVEYVRADRLNALEAERDALRELVKSAHEYMCETGEVPLHLAKQFQALGGGDE